jgi:cytochrome c oxidase cbb3-type subunit 4
MDYATLHSIATVSAVIAFSAVCWWAYRPANRLRFEADARMILDTDPILSRATAKIPPEEKGE